MSKKNRSIRVLVAGAGGFIGGHLVKYLHSLGFEQIRAVDIKPLSEWYQLDEQAENLQLDLSELANCRQATQDIDEVYNLAADMGGMGYIEKHKALCMLNVLINTHLLLAARDNQVKRFFYASSACVYNIDRQQSPDIQGLKENDAYPANPEDGYGWEKLFAERMCRHFSEDFALETRVARFHNVYGPHGEYQGGREKAPAALIRKVLEAQKDPSKTIEIWGDGLQSRTFMYIDDCVKGIELIMHHEIKEPVNLGTSELVTINQLVDLIEDIAGVKLQRKYNLNAPKGVRGRSSDNTLLRQHLNWEPQTPLREGLRATYHWIASQMKSGVKT